MLKISALQMAMVLFSSIANAQEIIPFSVTKYNNVIVKAFVNGKDSLDLMFQIAMQEASISPERLKSAESIIFKDAVSHNNTVKIGKVAHEKITFFDNELTGKGADGKIGTGFFEGKIYQINYDKNQFILYNQLPKTKGYKKVPFTTTKYGQLFITCTSIVDNKPYEGTFLLQSGYSGGILYSNEFIENNDLSGKLHIIGQKTLRNSNNQSITTMQGILPVLEIQGIILNNVTAGFFTGDLKNQKVNYFGADLIKRFNWIIDTENQVVYIKPSKYSNDSYFKIE